MAQYFEPSTDTNANFANSVSGQTNSYFLPSVYSRKVLNFFRKASVIEGITNTDYAGEISAYGDSVKIIKEPVISVSKLSSSDPAILTYPPSGINAITYSVFVPFLPLIPR